jgi:hypothetical protein
MYINLKLYVTICCSLSNYCEDAYLRRMRAYVIPNSNSRELSSVKALDSLRPLENAIRLRSRECHRTILVDEEFSVCKISHCVTHFLKREIHRYYLN